MADSQINVGTTDHVAIFDPEVYLEERTLGAAGINAYQEELNKGFAALFGEIFSALQPGERLLDVGSGPGIRNVISASAKYQHITLSDPVPQNGHMLQKYIDDVTEDQRWTEHFKLTAEMEGDAQKWPEVRDRMRARIKRVMWCDILQDEPLGKDQPEELFDCVLTTICLSTGCVDGGRSAYARAVRNLVSLAKPGGTVIICDAETPSFYCVGEKKFALFPSSEKLSRQCVEDAGCAVIALKKVTIKYADIFALPHTIFILQARKL